MDGHRELQPTADNYLRLVPMPMIVAAATEACGEKAGKQAPTPKKKEAVALAESKLAGTGWLPEILRTCQA